MFPFGSNKRVRTNDKDTKGKIGNSVAKLDQMGIPLGEKKIQFNTEQKTNNVHNFHGKHCYWISVIFQIQRMRLF